MSLHIILDMDLFTRRKIEYLYDHISVTELVHLIESYLTFPDHIFLQNHITFYCRCIICEFKQYDHPVSQINHLKGESNRDIHFPMMLYGEIIEITKATTLYNSSITIQIFLNLLIIELVSKFKQLMSIDNGQSNVYKFNQEIVLKSNIEMLEKLNIERTLPNEQINVNFQLGSTYSNVKQ